jgi:Domain of unknown function (DUF4397)
MNDRTSEVVVPGRLRRASVLISLAALLAVALVGGVAGPAAAQASTGTVTVIHGVPGVTVDVYVNGTLTLEDFAPGTVTAPLALPAGDYAVAIRPAGADPSAAPIISGSTTLPAGANATLIAHLAANGTPTLGVFVNDTTATAAGQGRLVVRHTAAAPAVDVLAGGTAVVSNLQNPNEATLSLPAGTVSAAVAAAGTTTPLIGPVDIPVVAGQVTIVYAIGSLDASTLGAVVQTIQVGQAAAPATPAPTTPPAAAVPVPSGVPAGDSGLAAGDGSSLPTGIALALVGLALTGVVVSKRRLAEVRAER